MTITIDGNGTITGASTLATTVASPTLTTPNINSAQFATVTGTAPIYPCRAWVNFNGTGTVAIRASGNVSSITDGGVGNYSVNFTTAMTDTNYSVVAMAYLNEAGTTYANAVGRANTTSSALLGAIQAGTATTLVDSPNMQVSIFR